MGQALQRGTWSQCAYYYGGMINCCSSLRSECCVASAGKFAATSKVKNGVRYIRIPGVPFDALVLSSVSSIHLVFVSLCSYEEEEMKKFVLHLLVLSHSYVVPSLKRLCEHILEHGWLTNENVIDVLQLARSCDAPRLALICQRMVVRDFKCISRTEAWKVMKRANPSLEQELLELVVEADSRKQDTLKKVEEKKVYLQLHEAMEALLHICRDGCRTIGPRDKVLKGSQVPCGFQACKGLETLIRHFSGCKLEFPADACIVSACGSFLSCIPACATSPNTARHFKVKMQQQSKKDEAKWKLLVSKVIAAKNAQNLFSSQRSSF
ncbi:UNVERIFIED_CONTAM: BTB/POZ and TAZ domain-containing protein 3 [Sesamum radiatum]|uniref:BTB/POZ and TAZ domain-containing protein 3 n=1 Tax=Sesamum radiatum TaxID=300843 RepID=A0AAW2QFH0_SESRA